MTARLTQVLPLHGQRMIVGFDNGISATLWLSRVTAGMQEDFSALADPALFRSATVSDNHVVWSNGLKLSGEQLYAHARGQH